MCLKRKKVKKKKKKSKLQQLKGSSIDVVLDCVSFGILVKSRVSASM